MGKVSEPELEIDSVPVLRTIAIMLAILLAPSITPELPEKVYAVFQSTPFRFAYLTMLSFFVLGTGNVQNAVLLGLLMTATIWLVDYLAIRFS